MSPFNVTIKNHHLYVMLTQHTYLCVAYKNWLRFVIGIHETNAYAIVDALVPSKQNSTTNFGIENRPVKKSDFIFNAHEKKN